MALAEAQRLLVTEMLDDQSRERLEGCGGAFCGQAIDGLEESWR